MLLVKTLRRIFLFILLTALTQIGGVVYLICFTTHAYIKRKIKNEFYRSLCRLGIFLFIYLFATFVVAPILAKPFGRVPLPISKTNNLRPHNVLTCFLNRNYVRLELRETAFDVARQMQEKFPGTVVNYLDANFPFINRFPLFPHLSHNDGKKLDISFSYKRASTGETTNECPSVIGYGICEEPRPGESNTTEICSGKGYWQYNIFRKIVPQGNKLNYIFDSIRTKTLVNIFAAEESIGKIFIEPHLKTRLRLTNEKIRFHGCHAVRHDDHIHIQLK